MPWAVVAAVAGGAIAADSSRKAGNKQSKANELSLEEQKRQFDLNREDALFYFNAQMAGDEELDRRNRADKEQSYQRGATLNRGNVDRGEAAGNQLSYLMGLSDNGTGEKGYLSRRFTEADMVKDGGYNFRMGEGQKGVGNQFAASGNLLSGAQMKALTRFNQDFASNEYGNAYSRFNNDQSTQYNRLAGMQGAGQNAINSINGLGGTIQGTASNAPTQFAQLNQSNNNAYASAYDKYQANQGNIQANQQMAYGQAWNNGLKDIKSAWDTYQTNNRVNNNTNSPIADGWGTGSSYGNTDYGSYF